MRILISNDDGLNSNGMLHLEEELGQSAEVWAVAPDRERSATSMAISIRDSLRVIQAGERRFMITGFPVDCVNVALFLEGFPQFDLVISGINHGVNLGDDVHYSGTVGAARHAAIHGYKTIAISSTITRHDGDFRRVSRWFGSWLGENFERLKQGVVYNINYPTEPEGIAPDAPLPEIRFTRQGRRVYHDSYRVMEEGGNYSVIHINESTLGRVLTSGSDFEALEQGFVSITPISISVSELEELEKWP